MDGHLSDDKLTALYSALKEEHQNPNYLLRLPRDLQNEVWTIVFVKP